MDAAMFQFNLSPQPANGLVPTAGATESASALGGLSGADAFAALLAQQLGQVVPELVVPDVAVKVRLVTDAESDIADEATAADSAALLAALQDTTALQKSEVVDSALQLQQSGFVPPVVVPAEVHSATTSSDALSGGVSVSALEARATPAVGMRDVSTGQSAINVTEGRSGQFAAELIAVQRQPVAVSPASFAANDASPIRSGELEFVAPFAKPDLEALPATASSGSSLPPGFAVTTNHQVQGLSGTTTTSQPTAVISPAVGQSAWGDSLGDRVVWMVSQQHQGVELHLNPPSLGPLEVRLSMNDGQATLNFATQHLPVKEAIESATPRLREMLGESGINLGSVSVNVGTFSQQQGQFEQSARESSGWSGRSAEAEFSFDAPKSVTRIVSGNGMVDIFA